MSVLIDKKTKVLVQGITGTQASFHVQRAVKYGTNIVAGVVPNKKENKHLGIPLYKTVKDAKKKTGATASMIFVPAKNAKDAIIEAIEAKMELIVVITSGITVSDMMEVKEKLKNSDTILIGPNTPGIITPNEAYMGIFPDIFNGSGNIGIVSRSSTLTYEVILEINKLGFGESSVVGLGDDFIIGSNHINIIEKFNKDRKTKAIVLIGGIGGYYELETAKQLLNIKKKKPIIALMLEDPTPLSDMNSIASEVIYGDKHDAKQREELLKNSGMIVVNNISELKEELLKL